MKYKVQDLYNGTYAVGYGKNKYFTNTICETFEEAQSLACEFSARWYQQQMDICHLEWIKLNPELDDRDWGNKLA